MSIEAIIAIVVAGITWLATVIGFVVYVKFQTNQNRKDIIKLDCDLRRNYEEDKVRAEKLELALASSTEKLYERLDISNQRVIKAIDGIKSDFVSTHSCENLRATCPNH